MSGNFQSQFAIGDRVLWHGIGAVVTGVAFEAKRTRYRLAFDAGGADSTVDSSEIGSAGNLSREPGEDDA